LVVDWVAEDTQSKAWQNQALDHPLALAFKVEGSEAALVVAVAASVEALEAIEAVSVVTEVGSVVEEALAIKVQVALEAEEDFQTVHLRQMHQADQADREVVGMVVGTELVLPTALDLTMATGVVAMDTGLVVNGIIVAAQAARQGLTAVEINVVE
jgi:hypothetical protein